jgi:outer membrane protein assembly factor BamB
VGTQRASGRRMAARIVTSILLVTSAALVTPRVALAGLQRMARRGASANSSPGDWPKEAFDATNSSFNPFESTLTPSNIESLGEIWSGPLSSPGPYLASSAAVVDGFVYGESGDELVVLDAAACTSAGGECGPTWTGQTDGAALPSPTVDNGVVYVPTNTGYLDAFSVTCASTTCDPVWKGLVAPGGSLLLGPPVIANGIAYVVSSDGNLVAFSIPACASQTTPCSPEWIDPIPGGAPTESPALEDSELFVTSTDGKLYAFPAACLSHSCGYLWAASVGAVVPDNPVAMAGTVYVNGDHLYAFDPPGCGTAGAECSPIWSGSVTEGGGNRFGDGAAIAAANGIVYLQGGDRQGGYPIDAFDVARCVASAMPCDPLWSVYPDDDAFTSGIAVANGMLFVTECVCDGPYIDLFALSATDGSVLQRLYLGDADCCQVSGVGDLAVSHGEVYIDDVAFGLVKPFSPTLTVTVNGAGSVNSSPPGISCPPTCTAQFPTGTQVELTPSPSSSFIDWGGECSGTGTCALTMDLDQSVVATFGLQVDPISGVNGYAGSTLADNIATITDPDPQDPAAYAVSIDWGDGGSSPPSQVVVVPQTPESGPPCPNLPESSPECFVIYARHTYANPGPYDATVTARVGEKVASSFVYVGISQGLFVRVNQLYSFAGSPSRQMLFTFTDVSRVPAYAYSIDWGNGQSTSGTLESSKVGHEQCLGGVPKTNCFDLFVNHTYPTTGQFTMTVCISKSPAGIATRQCDSNTAHVLSLPNVKQDYKRNAQDASVLYNVAISKAFDKHFHEAANAAILAEQAASEASADAELLYLGGQLPDQTTVRFWSRWAYLDFQAGSVFTGAAQDEAIRNQVKGVLWNHIVLTAVCDPIPGVGEYCLAVSVIKTVTDGLPVPGPAIESFSPTFGGRGTTVTVQVSLADAIPSRVTFGGVIASFAQTDSETIVATVPPFAPTGPICVSGRALTASSTGCSSQVFIVT